MAYKFVRGPRGFRGKLGYTGSIGQIGYTGSQGEIPELPETVMLNTVEQTMAQKLIQDQTIIQTPQARNVYISTEQPDDLVGNNGDIWIIRYNLLGTIYSGSGVKEGITVSIMEV